MELSLDKTIKFDGKEYDIIGFIMNAGNSSLTSIELKEKPKNVSSLLYDEALSNIERKEHELIELKEELDTEKIKTNNWEFKEKMYKLQIEHLENSLKILLPKK